MPPMRKSWPVVMAATLTAGCAASSPRPESYTVRQHASVTTAQAFAAAEEALGERFRIEVRRPSEGLLRTASMIAAGPADSARLGDPIRSPRRFRKTVEVRIAQVGSAVRIGCKVRIEENLTGVHRLFEREHGLSDIPSDTPIDRGAAATKEQESVWRVAGRDKVLERDISRTIDELLRKKAPSQDGA